MKLLLMGGIEPHPGPGHIENRNRVCAVCMLKAEKTRTGYRVVNEHQEELIREKVSSVYDKRNMCLPCGLCNCCRLKIERPYTCKKYPDYSKIFKNGSIKWTRERENNAEKCECHICKVSAANSHVYRKMIVKWKGRGKIFFVHHKIHFFFYLRACYLYLSLRMRWR